MTSPTMEAMQASQHVYVVKVRALPDPGLLFPSERRYSALTVAGLAAGHALLGCVALLLGGLALYWDPPQGSWVGHLGAGLWLGAAALLAAVSGALAWRRWYEDHYIAWFFRASLLAAVVAGAGLVLTSAALVHLHENVLSVRPVSPIHPADLPPHLAVYEPDHDVSSDAAVADEGSGGGSSWLDISDLPLPDANSSTISSGGVFSDLVRDQDHDLVAADSTRHEDREVPSQNHADTHSSFAGFAGQPEWSVLRWVPVPLPPRASAQIRSLLAANVLVACFLELLWALLGARLAWRGMRAADIDLAQAAAPAERAVTAAPLATLAALERGAADGKVDVDMDNSVVSDGELKKTCKVADGDKVASSSRKKKQQQQQHAKSAASLQRRRRAPQLPELHLSLEQRTMNLEERVARLLSPGLPAHGHGEQEQPRPEVGDG